MPINNRPVADCGPLSEADRIWYRIVRHLGSMRRGLGLDSASGRAQVQQGYIQKCLQCEANGEAAVMPTPGELDQILAGINDRARKHVKESLDSYKECKALEEDAATMLSAGFFIIDGGDEGMVGVRNGTQLSADQVDELVQASSRVELGSLESDEMECPICKLEYGSYRGDETPSTEPALDQELSGEDAPEQAIKLPCDHVFGDWCIKTWLLGLPAASCPTCRFQFKQVV